jgi:hypothetical protein
MISKDKTYKTRNGLEARIYATGCGGSRPVHGAVCENSVWDTISWTENGFYSAEELAGSLDLIEVKPRIKGWVNVYFSSVNKTKQEADNWLSSSPRIACIPVEFEEGEGL